MSSQGRPHPDLGYSRSSARVAGVASRLLLLLWFAVTLVPEARAADLLTEAVRSYAPVGYPRSAGGVLARAEQGDPLAQTYLGVMYLRGKGGKKKASEVQHVRGARGGPMVELNAALSG